MDGAPSRTKRVTGQQSLDVDVQSLRGWLRRRGYQGPRGPAQRALRDALRRFKEAGKDTFTLREAMADAGLDYDSKSDYIAAMQFLSRMREAVSDFSTWFWTQPRYKEYIDDGLTDKAVFRKLVTAMTSYEIFPVFFDADIDGYHLLTLEGWARLTHKRALAMRNEIVRRVEELNIMQQKFPMLKEVYPPPSLPTDGQFIQLPEKLGFHCLECGMEFEDANSYDAHMKRRHPEVEKPSDGSDPPPPNCPTCNIPLGRMEAGDYKCRECKQIFSKDDMNTKQTGEREVKKGAGSVPKSPN